LKWENSDRMATSNIVVELIAIVFSDWKISSSNLGRRPAILSEIIRGLFRQIPVQYLRLCHIHFVPYPFEFIVVFFIILNSNFKFQSPVMYVFMIVRRNGLIKSCLSFEDLTAYKMSCYVDWCKFFSHLISLNVHHFGMVEATALKIMASRWSSIVRHFRGACAPLKRRPTIILHGITSQKTILNF
jgi:hypothetical protein